MSARQFMSVSTIVLVWSALWLVLGALLIDARSVMNIVQTLLG